MHRQSSPLHTHTASFNLSPCLNPGSSLIIYILFSPKFEKKKKKIKILNSHADNDSNNSQIKKYSANPAGPLHLKIQMVTNHILITHPKGKRKHYIMNRYSKQKMKAYLLKREREREAANLRINQESYTPSLGHHFVLNQNSICMYFQHKKFSQYLHNCIQPKAKSIKFQKCKKFKNPNQIEIAEKTLALKIKIRNENPLQLPYIQFTVTIELYASKSNINKTQM